ncbi:MAG TPA: hypothetical protein VHB68_11080 [Steroidobacteraceae bacterium]|nr:hypothetical protein [Steroidobacteraceae bacterium]
MQVRTTTADTSYIRQLEQATDPWSFVETLRGLRAAPSSEKWLVARDTRMPVLWLRGDGLTYAADTATVRAIRRGSIRLSRLTLRKPLERAPTTELRSGMELSWFAGYHASGQLSPQLSADVGYRVGRAPSFGLIRPLPSQLRVAASLASAAANLSEIVARAGVSAREAIRTLNALYACDLLGLAGPEDVAPIVAGVAEARGGLTKLLHSVCKHLGRAAG